MAAPLIAGRYAVEGTLGEGAMGLVLRVRDVQTGAESALKVVTPTGAAAENTLLQFKQEFRLMTQVRHPNCCAVHDFGVAEDGRPFFTMEIVPGQGLDEIGRVDGERFEAILGQLLKALGYVHQLGFVHRDLKSANVRLTPDGQVKLMDFGLMDFAGRSGAPISGTPAYMAPEVIKRGPIDQRTDLYAVGVLGYELLTGKLPFSVDATTGGSIISVLRAQVAEPPRPPSSLVRDVNPLHEHVVMKLLKKEPTDRFRGAEEVLEALGLEASPAFGAGLLASPTAGRERELALISEPLDRVVEGDPGRALIMVGEPGVGKSRLLEEFRFACQLADVVYGQGSAQDRNESPYAPFVAVLRQLLPALRQYAPAALTTLGGVLVKLLPELDVEPLPDLEPPSKEKTRLQGTIAELLGTLARAHPTVIVLDDWHWADSLSVQLLAAVARSANQVPLAVVLAGRPTPDALAALPTDLKRVTILPLDVQGLHRMIGAMLGRADVEAPFVDAVAAFSGGNPFTARELLMHLVEQGVLQYAHGRWNTDEALGQGMLPRNLKGLLLRKFSTLPDDARAIAAIAAVAGPSSDLTLLREVSGLSEDALFRALERLRAHLVLVEADDGAYHFAQDQLQAIIRGTFAASDLAALHLACATALERRLGDMTPAEAPLDIVVTIAHHLLAGEATDRLVPFALEAGRRTVLLYANHEAERFLREGLRIVRTDQTGRWRAETFAYLVAWGDVSRALGQVLEGAAAYEEAIALAPAVGEAGRVGDMMTSLAKCHQLRGDLEHALTWCARSLAACEASGDRAGMARSLLTSCRVHYFSGRVTEALAHTERALTIAREAGDPARTGEALAFNGFLNTTAAADHVNDGIDQLHAAVEILFHLGDRIGLQNAYNLLGNAQNALGDFRDARETFMANRRLCFEAGMRDDLVMTDLNLAVCGVEMGDFRDAVRRARISYEAARAVGNDFNAGIGIALEAVARTYLGEFAGALALIEQAMALAVASQNKYMLTLISAYKVETYLVLGHLGEAKQAAKDLIALIKETGNSEPEARMNALLAEIVARQGDLEGAKAYVEAAMPDAIRAGAKGIQVRALKVRAWIAMRLGNWVEARSVAEQGLALARRIGARPLEAELLGVVGEVAVATRAGDARGAFAEMEELALAMGSDLLTAQALFGRAAALAIPSQAVPLVTEAQELLKGLMVGLPAGTRLLFSSLHERARILEGDFVGGFKPRGDDIGIKVSLPGLHFGQGGFGP